MWVGYGAYQQGNHAEAVKQIEAALALAEAFEPEDERLALNLYYLALIYQDQGKYAEAEPLYKRSLAIREKTFGAENPRVAVSLASLGGLYEEQRRYTEAEPFYKRALAISEKTLGPDDPLFATILEHLASVYHRQDKYAEAESLYQRALAIAEKRLGPDDPQVALSAHNLAVVYQDHGKYAEAEPLYKRALAISEKTLGPDDPQVVTNLTTLAALYDEQGRYTEAEPLFKRAIAIYEKTHGPDSLLLAVILGGLAKSYTAQGRYAEAEPLHKRSLAIEEKKLGPEHPSVAESLEKYSVMLRKTGRTSEAAELEARAKAILTKHPKENTSVRLYIERQGEQLMRTEAASASELEQNFAVGGPTSNLITVGKKQVMLPPGEWVIAGVYATRNNSGISMLQLFLIDAKAGVLQRASLIEANIERPMAFQGWKAHPVCRHKDFLYLVTNSAVEGEECWWVNHWSMTMPPKRESAWSRALEYARREGIAIPTNCVAVGYRLANDNDYLHLSYCFNPEAEGIVPPGRFPQNPSIWHVDRFDKDPKRAEYVDRLKNWGASWLPQVRAGFKGELKND
jgi:tetratricopeptide (TPR) repeat protein